MNQWTYTGDAGDLAAQSWTVDQPRYVAVLCHGYGDHIGRYEGGSVGDLPLLHLHGEDDQLVPIGPSQAGVEAIRGPRTEAKSYPGARHEIFNETNKEEVLADVAEFIEHSTGRARGARSI